MTGIVWISGAERLRVSAPGGDITSTAEPRVVWHTTEAPSGDPRQWQNMQNVLTSKGSEPQVLWDPITDRLGQFMGLDVSGRALKNDGNTRTNRVGRVCIQIEVIAYAAKPFTDYWKPGPNFRALMAAIRSWGIPNTWPAGPPPKYVNGQGNVPPSPRDRNTWLTKGGHYSHAQIPGNIHGDPGGISTTKLFIAAGTPASVASPPKDEFTVAEADRVISELKKYIDSKISGIEGDRWAQDINENRAQTVNLTNQITKLTGVVTAIKAKTDKLP